jgi:hypothetical protein
MHLFYAHDILGFFCILKRVCQVLGFSLPDTTVFQYLRRHIDIHGLSLLLYKTAKYKRNNKYKIHLGYIWDTSRKRTDQNLFWIISTRKLQIQRYLFQSCLQTYIFHGTDKIRHSFSIANNSQTNHEVK